MFLSSGKFEINGKTIRSTRYNAVINTSDVAIKLDAERCFKVIFEKNIHELARYLAEKVPLKGTLLLLPSSLSTMSPSAGFVTTTFCLEVFDLTPGIISLSQGSYRTALTPPILPEGRAPRLIYQGDGSSACDLAFGVGDRVEFAAWRVIVDGLFTTIVPLVVKSFLNADPRRQMMLHNTSPLVAYPDGILLSFSQDKKTYPKMDPVLMNLESSYVPPFLENKEVTQYGAQIIDLSLSSGPVTSGWVFDNSSQPYAPVFGVTKPVLPKISRKELLERLRKLQQNLE